jgi:hypothetical protein
MIVAILLCSGCIIKGRVVDENGFGVAGVTINLNGNATMSTTTDSDGNYQLGSLTDILSAGSYTVTPSGNFSPANRNITIATQTLDDIGDVPWFVDGVDFTQVTDISDGRLRISVDKIERTNNYTDLERYPAKSGYDYYIIHLTINQITGGHLFANMNYMVPNSKLLNYKGQTIDCIDRNASYTMLSFKDPNSLTSPTEFAEGSRGTLLFEISENEYPETLIFPYAFGETWSDYNDPDHYQIEIDLNI